MLTTRDNFLDTFIVDFYSSNNLKIKPCVGWGIDDKLPVYVHTRNFNATMTISSEDLDGFRSVYIDVSISLQTRGGGIITREERFQPRKPYFNAIYRILRVCGFLTLPAWYFPVRQPPVCMNGLYYV